MGTQSTITPNVGSGHLFSPICKRTARYGAAICVAMLLSCSAWAQSASTPLLLPSAIAFDAQGALYFAETGNHIVRELAADGTLSIVAGSGVQGFSGDNGPAIDAEFDSPQGLAVDAAGNLYIADSHNHRIRKVDAAGTITTIAGTGVAGFFGDGGAATAAQLDLPTALAVDSAGSLYIADTNNHRVRRIDSKGNITTFAGDGVEGFGGDNGPAKLASIDSPNGLTLDSAGNLYIADTHNGRVRRVDAAGVISTVAGVGFAGGNVQMSGGDGGAATAAGLALPRGLTMDAAGSLYVADSANHRIRRVSPGGTITSVAGQGTEAFAGDGAPAVAASLDSPRSVAVSSAGLLTLADTANQRIRQLDALPAPGPDIHTIAGLGATGSIVGGAGPDYSLAATGQSSQSVRAGGAATFSFSVANTGAPLASPILLAAQGAPTGAVVSLNPMAIPPGGAVTTFTLTVQTPAASASQRERPLPTRPLPGRGVLAALLVPALGWVGRSRLKGSRGRGATLMIVLVALLPLGFATGCGDRINPAPESVTPKTYTLTVTGTATSAAGTALQHSVSVTLNVL